MAVPDFCRALAGCRESTPLPLQSPRRPTYQVSLLRTLPGPRHQVSEQASHSHSRIENQTRLHRHPVPTYLSRSTAAAAGREPRNTPQAPGSPLQTLSLSRQTVPLEWDWETRNRREHAHGTRRGKAANERKLTYLAYLNTAPTKTPQGLARAHDFKLPLSGRHPSPSCPQQTPPEPTANQPLAPNTASITSHQSPSLAVSVHLHPICPANLRCRFVFASSWAGNIRRAAT